MQKGGCFAHLLPNGNILSIEDLKYVRFCDENIEINAYRSFCSNHRLFSARK